ncbi:MAG: MetQ/NlpA family ABC transporter substrate-binding protein [Veillonellaceae bacterium]|nr:MetQ/NlpA family ABC transporter substrate-binding protein [Veillonellaceae bacterium]
MKKKWFTLAGVGVLACALMLGGCGEDKKPAASSTAGDKVVVKVGASPVPHAEILEQVKDKLAKEGVELKVIEFTDYIQPNMALSDKELDANYFQHKPYLDNFAQEHNLKLAVLGAVHLEPMGVYSRSLKEFNPTDVPEGAKVAIPNDPTNGGRALLLLQQTGLIHLKSDAGILATVADIDENPRNLQFSELEAAQIPRALDDVALAVINTNYAIEAGLNPKDDALVLEDENSPYTNIVAIREGDENRPELQKLLQALQSDDVKKFINEKYKGAILPAF